MTEQYISSVQNPKVKKLVALQQKSSERRKEGLFVVEGCRELMHCLEAGYEIDTVFHCPSIMKARGEELPADFLDSASSIEVTEPVYEKIAYRGSTEGIMATVHSRSLGLDDLTLCENPLIVVLERVEKPGNLGAILRSVVPLVLFSACLVWLAVLMRALVS